MKQKKFNIKKKKQKNKKKNIKYKKNLNKNKNYFMRHVFLLFQKVFIICDIEEIC